MAKSGMCLLVVSVGMALITVSETDRASARMDGPPPGLTAYGRVVWNLDALLHDTFGQKHVYLNTKQSYPRSPANFSTSFINNARSRYYIFTFANAHSSVLRTIGPTKLPKPNIGASGYEVPLTIRGAYIYCGRSRWLFEHGGNGPANWQVSCHR